MTKNLLVLISISIFISVNAFSQHNATINKIIEDINKLVNPEIEFDAVKGSIIFSVYKNGDLRRESSMYNEEVNIENISYSNESNYLRIPCKKEDCVEKNTYGNNKSKKYTSQIRLKITDSLKGREASKLLIILLSEMNKQSVVRLESKSNFIELSPHLVSIMIDQLFYLNAGLAYEYITKKERLGYKVLLIYSPKYKFTETGLALKIYLGKNKANIYNLGSVHLGTASIRYYTGPELIYFTKSEYDFVALRVQNGVSFQSKKHINATFHTSMGAKNIISSNDVNIEKGETSFSWGLYFYLGWRF